MSKISARLICFLCLFAGLPLAARAQDKYVYKVKIAECKFEPRCARAQTGFRVKGIKGIVTALHGVADGNDIRVVGAPGAYSFEGPLKISKVDVKHDIALLTSQATESAPADGLEVDVHVNWDALDKVVVVGYPLNVPKSKPRERKLGIPRLETLRGMLPGKTGELFLDRRSPDPDEQVVNVDATLLRGDSGAPALDAQGRVVAVADGGLLEGLSQICWAIPWSSVKWEYASTSNPLATLRQIDPGALFSFDDDNKSRTPEIYRVRITVLNVSGMPVNEAKVISSIGGEALAVPGGYQFEIAGAKRPKDGKITFFATKESAFLSGKVELLLEDDPNPTISISLTRDTSAIVRGFVVDDSGMSVVGARVSVVGYDLELVVTKAGGGFVLPAHAANGQQVLLHAEGEGFKPLNQWHPAGDTPVTLILERK